MYKLIFLDDYYNLVVFQGGGCFVYGILGFGGVWGEVVKCDFIDVLFFVFE